jgi:methionyl-tRNA formyltransferase
MIVAAYGLILPRWVLETPRMGCMNIHASLLPRWRGAAPIHRAIEAGDAQTGVTIMQMDEGLDTGDMLLTERIAIAPDDTTGRLHDRLATLGGRLIVEALEIAACGGLTRTPQPSEGVTYANKIDKAESLVDWAQPADVIARRIRAFNPAPGATATLQGETIKLWRAGAIPGRGSVEPGTIVAIDERGIGVACGDGGRLEITELQRAGGKRLPVADFLRGCAWQPGMRFETAR